MGNLIPCMKKNSQTEQLLAKQCPYCKFCFSSENEKKMHTRNCVYNVKGDDRELSIYSDPYRL